MKEIFSIEQIKNLETQLAFPKGKKGIEIAKTMNNSNAKMITDTIDVLDIKNNDTILELGHGNCSHLELIIEQVCNISYYGLEVSKTMQQEARKINKKFIKKENVFFDIYDGLNIPYENNLYDKIMSVNTIYFWKNPIKLLSELYRVLKNEGVLVLTFAEKNFMKTLPFVKEKFNLFDENDIKKIIDLTGFKIVDYLNKDEHVESKTGELVNRKFNLVVLKKSIQ